MGALRGTANNLSTALGAAVASALAIAILGALIASLANAHPEIPPALLQQVNKESLDEFSE